MVYLRLKNTPLRVGCSNLPYEIELLKALDAPYSGTSDKRLSAYPSLKILKLSNNVKEKRGASAKYHLLFIQKEDIIHTLFQSERVCLGFVFVPNLL